MDGLLHFVRKDEEEIFAKTREEIRVFVFASEARRSKASVVD